MCSVENAYWTTSLHEFPSEWEVLRIGDFAETSSGGTPSRTREDYFRGEIPWVKSGELGDGTVYRTGESISEAALKNSSAKLVPKGTLLVALYGATAGKVAILDIEAATNQAVCAVFPDGRVDTHFLFYMLVFRRNDLLGARYGGAQPNISQRLLRDFPVAIPPLDEQRAIAAVLNTVREAIEATEWVIAAARELKRSLMKYLFTYGPVPVDAAGDVELHETAIGEIPAGWEMVPLGDVADLTMGQSPPSSTYNSDGIGLHFLQGKAEFGAVYPQPIKFCSDPIRIGRARSVLISVRAPVGDVNIAPFDCCIGRGLAAIEGQADLDNLFLFYQLEFFKKRLEDQGTGSTFKSINKGVLAEFLTTLPPLDEQRAIAEFIWATEEKIEVELQRKSALQSLFDSFLHHLMTGRVRVKV
jgi:type I restriction enzyme, S subunit